jgi:hypothetical protein
MKKYLLILGLLLVINSCKRSDSPADDGFNLYFENPQPINDSELSKIPNKFIGLFMDSDSGYVNVKENIVLKEHYYKFKFHKKDMDSIKEVFNLVGNKYIFKINNEAYDYKYIGDSIEFSNKQIDTFFIFSKTQIAKRFNGQLVLNYKDSIFWNVKTLHLEKDVLKITYHYSQDDLKRMDSVTKIKSVAIDTATYISKPSRNEFKRILNLKNLGYEQNYKRVVK